MYGRGQWCCQSLCWFTREFCFMLGFKLSFGCWLGGCFFEFSEKYGLWGKVWNLGINFSIKYRNIGHFVSNIFTITISSHCINKIGMSRTSISDEILTFVWGVFSRCPIQHEMEVDRIGKIWRPQIIWVANQKLQWFGSYFS